MTVEPSAANTLRRVARLSVEAGAVLGGLMEYYFRGDISDFSRRSLLDLHCQTNGKFTTFLTPLMRAARPPRPPSSASGVLGELSVARQREIAATLDRDGFYVFDELLPADVCDEIEAYASKTPAVVEGSDQLMLFDRASPTSKTYRIRDCDVLRCEAMQRLMADRSILAVAETYLKTLPMISMLNLWFSPAYGNAPGADAAQEYHFDFDPPPIWLLFFIYLTDVGPDNGPHIFVRGTHKPGLPQAKDLLQRGYVRIPDEEIAANFGSENIVEIHGRRGTILAVDTRGFHKGKMPVVGHRLMAQLTFSCPPFSGAHGRKVRLPAEITPELAEAIAETPKVFLEKYPLSADRT